MVELYLRANNPASNARNQGNIILSSRPRAGTTKRKVTSQRTLTRTRHYLEECCSFSLLSMPTKLADGLGLRDVLLEKVMGYEL
jgi:hypothetical protein